jgi:DNA polymerase III subunit gamma/tau
MRCKACLGALDQAYLVRMLDALAVRDAKALLDIADEMAARSLSWSGALQDLGTLLNRIAIAQTVPSAVPDDLPERDDIVRLAPMFSPEDVQLYYQIVVHGRHELGLAPDEYSGFTMTLLRMLAFAPIDGGGIAVAATAPSLRALHQPLPLHQLAQVLPLLHLLQLRVLPARLPSQKHHQALRLQAPALRNPRVARWQHSPLPVPARY